MNNDNEKVQYTGIDSRHFLCYTVFGGDWSRFYGSLRRFYLVNIIRVC